MIFVLFNKLVKRLTFKVGFKMVCLSRSRLYRYYCKAVARIDATRRGDTDCEIQKMNKILFWKMYPNDLKFPLKMCQHQCEQWNKLCMFDTKYNWTIFTYFDFVGLPMLNCRCCVLPESMCLICNCTFVVAYNFVGYCK